MPFHGRIVLRTGVVLPFRLPAKTPSAEPLPAEKTNGDPSSAAARNGEGGGSSKLDCKTFQTHQGGVWHEFNGFNQMLPVSKCGRAGGYSTKLRTGRASCLDCAAKGTK